MIEHIVKRSAWFGLVAATMLQAQTTATLTGKIIGEGGQPVSASVSVVRADSGLRMKTVPADERGNFSVELPPGPASVVARADGYASEQRDVNVRPGRTNVHLNFNLARAGSLSGRVTDPAGNGIPRARVWVQYRGDSRAWASADEIGGEEADEFGNFTIPVVPQGRPFVLHAESDGWLLSSSRTMMLRSDELTGVILLLSRRGGTITGRVVDSGGRPVSGAHVRLRTLPAEGEFTPEQRASLPFVRNTHRVVVSGEDGSYSFQGVPAGRAVISAERQNRRGSVERETVSGQQAIADLLVH